MNDTGGRERGARRRKLAGYLKAANELRHNYQQTATAAWASSRPDASEGDQNGLDAVVGASTVRVGEEEMVLFPSYALRHVKRRKLDGELNGAGTLRTIDRRQALHDGNADPLSEDGNADEEDHAVVDVNVRGWVSTPHRGPLTRKNRLLIGLARHLSGIPAPTEAPPASSGIPNSADVRASRPADGDGLGPQTSPIEEDLISMEAESIVKKGEEEARLARRGVYSEGANQDGDSSASPTRYARSSTPEPGPGRLRHPLTEPLAGSHPTNGSKEIRTRKRTSWTPTAEMSPADLVVANANLMARLLPFLNAPLVNVPIAVLFYNDQVSHSRTVYTNEAGHFWVRVSLDFVPTHVRVLASDHLSAVEEVHITEPTGISLISDIDDTIKHSAIGSGAKEIFRNTFVRDLADLTVDGVRDWYKKLASLGVKLHYVSNAPWQLYPFLVKFFALEGLPPGSFHLKQYSGMLQGIFEPVAERKKSTLESIMRDFPERKFILVGDSGEADLEVYTDVVLANPGRIIAVYIRDVTTPKNHGFFDPSVSVTEEAGTRDDAPSIAGKTPEKSTGRQNPRVGTLIDVDDEISTTPPSAMARRHTTTHVPLPTRCPQGHGHQAPVPPPKPTSLRSDTTEGVKHGEGPTPFEASSTIFPPAKISPPAIPPKPRKYTHERMPSTMAAPRLHGRPPTAVAAASSSRKDDGSSSSSWQEPTSGLASYLPALKQRATTAYNRLPSATTVLRGAARIPTSSQDRTQRIHRSGASLSTDGPDEERSPAADGPAVSDAPAPPPPPRLRRAISGYPAAAAHYATNRLSIPGGIGGGSSSGDGSSTSASVSTGANLPLPINKKEELWKRRWARAKEILEVHGVELRTWRVGRDVMDDAVRLVQAAIEEMHRPQEDPSGK
ncbi:MAG: hypothetical protein M1826_002593 [Phylliscum demangeonii]|nr:MAG: hypothetical protein M1826_002593 [Phylliscum demangeonii]